MDEPPPVANGQQSDDTFTLAIKKSTLYAAFVVIVSFASGFGVAWLVFGSGEESPEVAAQTEFQVPSNIEVDIEGRPFLGPEDAPVTIVEFTDYECPFCGRHFEETLPELLDEYEGSIKYVVLNFPITRIHPSAQLAAEAAECAHDQGRFWEYHDILFENQQALDLESLQQYAVDLGLESEAFGLCLVSGAKASLVLDDVQDGLSYGVSGTPSFFINGRLIVGAQPLESFRALIDDAIGQ